MATKVFGCLICVFVLLVLFSLDCDAFGNGAGMAKPGKRTLQRNTMRVSIIISRKKKKNRTHTEGREIDHDVMKDKLRDMPRYASKFCYNSIFFLMFKTSVVNA